jgi:hypothetical protein
MKICGHATDLILYVVVMSKWHWEAMLGYLEVRCDKSIKTGF